VPRKAIKISPKVEYLSILDEKGQVDAALAPKLDADFLLKLFRTMLLTRRYDERCIALQRQGRIGTFGGSRGQEAASIASTMAITADDWMVQAYREPGACMLRGWPIEKLLQFWGGYEEGCQVPDGINDTPIAVPIASQNLHATGIAWAMKLKGKRNCVLCFCGDGATSEGDFHEACNFAGVFKAPVIFLVQNNQYAISVPCSKQTCSETLAQKALAYGFDGIQVDGNDAPAVYVATKEAVEKAKSGGGPTLIEAVTYRLGAHTTADDPTKYRTDDELKTWEKRDPLPRLEKYLRSKQLLDDKTLTELETDIAEQIRSGIERYEAAREVDPLDTIRFTYKELPAELVAQREEFRRYLEQERELGGD
jgi:pyruvate dehydrogenase E1 component alpha subunit